MPAALLREVWRVLAAGGRLLAVVPNRRGVWARTDTTPFGHGRPYSRSQINQLLRETWFTPSGWSEALYVPPVPRGWFLRSAVAWERTGATLSAPFAGVHLVEATKQVYRAVPAQRRFKRSLVPALEPVLAPLRRSLAAHCFEGLLDDLDLIVEPWGDEAWARGAAGLMLDELFHARLDREVNSPAGAVS